MKHLPERTRTHQPLCPCIAHCLAVLHDRMGNTEAALKEYQIALRKTPKNADLLNDLGYFHLQGQQLPEAEALFRKAVEETDGILVRRIIGFGYARSIAETNDEVSFERLDPQPIASKNDSSTFGPPPPGWQDLNLDSWFNRIHGADLNPYLIKTPVLLRTIR